MKNLQQLSRKQLGDNAEIAADQFAGILNRRLQKLITVQNSF